MNPKTALEAFEHEILIRRVASRFVQAMEFNTPEALKAYLKAHPGADKSKHSVKKKDEGGKAEGESSTSKKSNPLTSPSVTKHLPAGFAEKINAGKASVKEIAEAAEAFEESSADDEDVDDDEIWEVAQHLNLQFAEAVQKSPDYTKTKVKGYHPGKRPKGYKDAEGAVKIKAELSDEQRAWAEAMPEEDLDKTDAYNHPKIKSVAKKITQKVKSGEMSRVDFQNQFKQLDDLRSKMHAAEGEEKPTNDKDKDGWRFPARQLYKLWQAYNAVDLP